MGTTICTRRQKGFLQTGFCLLAVASGVFWYNHLQQKVKAAEDSASRHRQQQEALSAQLQVVYEHRSRLERSLQKERSDHKKTKEDFLVYKLEAQEALNKEKQDSMNRYGALSSQHKILKNQHEEVKKQLLDLQLLHNGLKLEHRKALETHNQKYSQWQREKETEVTGLQDTVYKLREESKLLRKAHQDVHSQLLNAQVQMEEFRKLKETLQRMPSFKDMGVASQEQQMQQPHVQPLGLSMLQLARPKASKSGIKTPLRPQDQAAGPAGNSLVPAPGVKHQGEENLVHENQISRSKNRDRPQGDILFDQLALPKEIKSPLKAQLPAGHKDEPMIRYTRMVNSLQNEKQDPEALENLQQEDDHSEAIVPGFKLPPASEEAQTLDGKLAMGRKQDLRLRSWQEMVNKVNAQRAEKEPIPYPQSRHLNTGTEQSRTIENQAQKKAELEQQPIWGTGKGGADDGERHMDAGMIAKGDHSYLRTEVPRGVAEPAQDPNNQREDEFEEAELERPNFPERIMKIPEVRREMLKMWNNSRNPKAVLEMTRKGITFDHGWLEGPGKSHQGSRGPESVAVNLAALNEPAGSTPSFPK